MPAQPSQTEVGTDPPDLVLPGLMDGVAPAPPRARASRPGLLTNVQVLRGLAALSVAVFHTQEFVNARRGPTGLGIFDPRFGLMGVAIFFAISGYLMARLVRASDPATFLAHRVLRILPPFLVLAFGFRLASPVLGINIPFHALALTLAPVGHAVYPLGGEWTLVCETTFYVVMFLIGIAALTHRIEALAVAWLAVIGVAWLVRPPISADPAFQPVYAILLTSPCAAFAGGLLLPSLLQRRLFPAALGLLAVPLAVASGVFATDANRWIGGLGAVILVGCAVQAHQMPVRSWPARMLVRFGDWSYILYLIHVPIILALLVWVPASCPPLVLWCIAVSTALAAAALVGPLDVRGYRHLKRWVDHSTASRRWMLCCVYLAVFAAASLYGGAITALSDYRIARVERALARLPAGALSSAGAAGAAIRDAGLAPPATLRGEAEEGHPRASPPDVPAGLGRGRGPARRAARPQRLVRGTPGRDRPARPTPPGRRGLPRPRQPPQTADRLSPRYPADGLRRPRRHRRARLGPVGPHGGALDESEPRPRRDSAFDVGCRKARNRCAGGALGWDATRPICVYKAAALHKLQAQDSRPRLTRSTRCSVPSPRRFSARPTTGD